MGELTWNGTVHPAADIFPMLPDEELAELAEDIKANGLREEIRLDHDGTLVDGRNRQRACELAGLTPRYAVLNGEDPVVYILSANVHRRNLSKGQRTLAAVLLKALPSNGFAYGEQVALAEDLGVNPSYLRMAHSVAAHPDLVERVMAHPLASTNLSLPEAYREVRERQSEAERLAAKQEREDRLLGQMQAEAADLADLVAQKKLAVPEALAAWEQRKQDRLKERTEVTESVARILVDILYGIAARGPEKIATDWYPKANPESERAGAEALWTAEGVRSLATTLTDLADAIDTHKNGRLQ